MGNTICGKGGMPKKESPHFPAPIKRDSEINLTQEELDEQRIETMLRDMKEYHKNRLRSELENDPHTFILDNLLMCIQFFDHFEKSLDLANDYKRNVEREMTELMSKDPLEGMILGDRHIKLLSGMSHILAQNYIYKGKDLDEDEVDKLYGGVGLKNTFTAEGILPLEFTMTWDNLELYDASEFQTLKDYSDAKGASPIARFCMEQADMKTNIPKGYARLRCVDEPASSLKNPDLVHHSSSDFGYAGEPVYNKPYSDAVSEAASESDIPISPVHSIASSEEDEMEDLRRIIGMKSNPQSWPTMEQSMPSTSKSALTIQNGNRLKKPNLPKLQLPQKEPFPSFAVHAPTPTPPTSDGSLQMRLFENSGFLSPPTTPSRIHNQHSKSVPNLVNPSRDSPGKETTSGYDTTSSHSITSSIASERARDRWQQMNLKLLRDYGRKSRKEQIPVGAKYDPIPAACYSEIKYEFSYDDPNVEDEEEDDESEESSSESETDEDDIFTSGKEKTKKKKKKNEDEDCEIRFYLNSLQFSSNACSEFALIGSKIKMPESSLAQGVVLGTTIRCPIAYTFPKDNVEENDADIGNYYVTYTFTPSLHSKSWPKGMYFHFNKQIFEYSNGSNVHGEIWPSRSQMEQIELLGCNATPIGHRAVDFFNAEQILQWELNFQDCEVNLLNSFRSAQWRAYIFSSILFRAFIAPLGPQGIGHEHIRNTLYFMCHENFSGWNDEQPGNQLQILLDDLYDCLSRGRMPSFFVRSRNLFLSIPQQNLRFVQGHIKQIRENLIIYSIYAFRNLMNVGKPQTTYPFPNLKSLYDILTVPDGDLLKIQNPTLQMQKDKEDAELREKARRKARKKKKKNRKPNILDLEQQDTIDRQFFSSQKERHAKAQAPKRDKVNEKLWRDYRKYAKKLEEQKKEKDRELQRLKNDPEHRLPETEKRKSINLKKSPVIRERFTPFRILLIIQFFLKHFLEMAQKSVKLHNYSQATMYVHQIENLVEIVQEDVRYKDVLSPFHEDDLYGYRQDTLRLRAYMGKDMHQYVLARLTMPPSQSSPSRFQNESGNSAYPTFTNNWDLRKLPTPPPSEKDVRPSGKRLSKPNIAGSLQSFPSRILVESPPPTASMPSLENRMPRRQDSIKFLGRETPPPPTPPRSSIASSRPLSRQSLVNLSLDQGDESTDL